MPEGLILAAAQIDQWVGDVDGNVERMLAAAKKARDELGAQVVVFPELSLIGYPPDDLLLRSGLPPAVEAGVQKLCNGIRGITAIIGLPEYADGRIYNSAYVIAEGAVQARYRKQYLPNYGVFDEQRHYSPGDAACVIEVAGYKLGITVCEDIWFAEPAARAKLAGADLLLNLNASPFDHGKSTQRRRILKDRVNETGLPVLYVNCVGGQDELVFDGDSMAVNADGEIAFHAPSFEDGVYAVQFDGAQFSGERRPDIDPDAAVYEGLKLAIRDYIDRNGFPGALIGLSGGIDSALTLALAVDALGPERVWAVTMPSRYNAQMSMDDAGEQARRMGCRFDTIEIESHYQAFETSLQPYFEGRAPDLTEENIQSRSRGVLLMALSNKFGHLVLATGNKSEMGVGYATLYGDMAGGFAPLKDVYKTTVYRLARYRNTISEVIPERVITRPPSAELRNDQKDSDSLPDYEVLDALLVAYVEQQQSIGELIAAGHDEALVRRVASLVRRSEYKRRQAPPGPKITPRAFGRDRRYPITAVYGDL